MLVMVRVVLAAAWPLGANSTVTLFRSPLATVRFDAFHENDPRGERGKVNVTGVPKVFRMVNVRVAMSLRGTRPKSMLDVMLSRGGRDVIV